MASVNSCMNVGKPLVSVVVPSYNVEKYITKCIRSIMMQTYDHIEIIAVNDGSTDQTGQILDVLSKQDHRIKVLHKLNGGVSAARNIGIESAKGEYIVFVDGDDYLDLDYIGYMMRLVATTGAEFCLSKYCFTRKYEEQIEKQTIEVLEPAEATALLLSPKVIVGCWNKIYKKSLLMKKNIRFSTELFYGEGLHFITSVAQSANCVGVGNRKVYYYRKNNPYSATTKFDIRSIYNGELALNRIEAQMSVKNSKIDTMLILHRSMYYIGALSRIKAHRFEEQYKNDYQRWLSYIRRNILFILKSRDISLYRKLLLGGGCISPGIMSKLDMMRRKRIEANSINDM